MVQSHVERVGRRGDCALSRSLSLEMKENATECASRAVWSSVTLGTGRRHIATKASPRLRRARRPFLQGHHTFEVCSTRRRRRSWLSSQPKNSQRSAMIAHSSPYPLRGTGRLPRLFAAAALRRASSRAAAHAFNLVSTNVLLLVLLAPSGRCCMSCRSFFCTSSSTITSRRCQQPKKLQSLL